MKDDVLLFKIVEEINERWGFFKMPKLFFIYKVKGHYVIFYDTGGIILCNNRFQFFVRIDNHWSLTDADNNLWKSNFDAKEVPSVILCLNLLWDCVDQECLDCDEDPSLNLCKYKLKCKEKHENYKTKC